MTCIRHLLICILLCAPTTAHAGQRHLSGTVIGDDGKPVAFCVIKPAGSNNANYSTEQGQFSFEYNSDSSRSVIFYCLGYETRELPIAGDTLKVVLKRKVNTLNDVVISASSTSRKIKEGILGKKNLKPFGSCYADIGSEYAIFLDADINRRGILGRVYMYITNEGIPSSRFRIHIYDIDTGYMPGNDLLDSNVILHGDKGNEWLSVDLSAKHIPIGGGIFVSMEWIPGYGNSDVRIAPDKFKGMVSCNGQVMSFTQSYYKQGSLLYGRSVGKPWNYKVLAGSLKRNVLNPMIYATYTYNKK